MIAGEPAAEESRQLMGANAAGEALGVPG